MSSYKVESEFEHKGLRCVVIMINTMGHRCGYVGVNEKHPLYKADYDTPDAECHGGLTYSGGGEESKYPIESDLWWFGYDCAHFGDAPDLEVLEPSTRAVYQKFPTGGVIRSLDYCIKECKKLAEQLADYK